MAGMRAEEPAQAFHTWGSTDRTSLGDDTAASADIRVRDRKQREKESNRDGFESRRGEEGILIMVEGQIGKEIE